MKIATWNVNSLTVRLPQVLEWLERVQPDVLALQETKVTDDKFPLAELRAAGYEAYFSGQKTYNGVALITKHSAGELVIEFPNFADPQRRIIAASVGDIRVINFYVPNGAAVDSEKYAYK